MSRVTKGRGEHAGIGLALSRVSRRFGDDTVAADALSLEIPSGTLCCLLGPSGCGKSTCLRMIAGLETPDQGRIHIGGRDMQGVAPQRRDVGLVFQQYALFPHMDVFANIAYGISGPKMDKRRAEAEVNRVLALVRLRGYGGRRIAELSGGEQQRVALARALIINPSLLLLDEPFSNLDAQLKETMGAELRELQQALRLTTVLVTHDQHEAMALADQIVLMRQGRIEQVGSPRELYVSPASSFVARFLGQVNLFPPSALIRIAEAGPWQDGALAAKYLAVRPESIRIHRAEDGTRAKVERVSYRGPYVRYRLSLSLDSDEPFPCLVQCPGDAPLYAIGAEVGIHIPGEAVIPLNR